MRWEKSINIIKVKVSGKLYYDTGRESEINARCGNMDGKIISHVSELEIPRQDNESNFEGDYGYQYGEENTIEIYINGKWYVFEEKEERSKKMQTALTLEDEIQDNTIWCGTFQLIWNDLKNDLAKQDIKFAPQLQVVENLNKETFTVNDISDKYYYKKYGTPTLDLKKEIEKAIKDKFNEKSDILDDFEWIVKDTEDYFLYAMLKKDFKFEKEFEELENCKFKDYEDVSYFGIKGSNDNNEVRKQINVLYYNSKDNFAIKLKTEQEDEVIFCKNPQGDTFNQIYKNIINQSNIYNGSKEVKKGEALKIPNIKLKQKTEFKELQNKPFLFSNGSIYGIEKAIQAIEFELDRTGGKVKSEAGMMLRKGSAMRLDETREFILDDTFAVFLIENDKDTPYFSAKISDITKFQ